MAIIACDHGLGHIRRSYLIGLKFASNNYHVDMFSPTAKFKIFQKLYGANANLSNYNFETLTSFENILNRKDQTIHWFKRLPSLKQYGIVISDNLPEILYIRKDAILSGHFFWHQIFSDFPKEWHQSITLLLHQSNPLIIGSQLFSASYISQSNRYFPVGLFLKGNPQFSIDFKRGLLISAGSTDSLNIEINNIDKSSLINFKPIFIDKNIGHSNLGSIAEYDAKMYEKIGIGICRPGIGTLTDLLAFGARPICIFENYNQEMFSNVMALTNNYIGSGAIDFQDALNLSLNFISDTTQIKLHQNKVKEINFNGSDDFFNIIKNG